jgi:hypothetical protein
MNELVTREVTNDELLDERLKEKLKFWGVPDNFIIEDEAKGPILAALSEDDVLSVYIDKENGLCINYSGDGFDGFDGHHDFIPNVSV